MHAGKREFPFNYNCRMARGAQLLCILTIIKVLFIHSVLSSPFSYTSQPSLRNLTPPNPNRIRTCTSDPHWIERTVKYEDCLEALRLFRQAEGQKSGQQSFEFVAPGAQKISKLLPLFTPRIYTSKTCTVVVAMLATFPIRFLPPKAQRNWYPPTDVATLNDLQGAAETIVEDCVLSNGRGQVVGWSPQGHFSQAIAVTVWESGSFMDRLIHGRAYLALNSSATVALTS